MKIGVIIQDYRKDIHEGARLAKEAGAEGIQLYDHEFSQFIADGKVDAAACKAYREELKELGLEVCALGANLAADGFMDEAKQREKETRFALYAEVCALLGASCITAHLGPIPATNDEERQNMVRVCREIGERVYAQGVCVAIETGPQFVLLLKQFIQEVNHPGIRVNLDPANLVMICGEDAVMAVGELSDYIVFSHAKDGILLQYVGGDGFYNAARYGKTYKWYELFEETLPGKGDVHFEKYLRALVATGYDGWLTLEREFSNDQIADVKEGLAYLRALTAKIKGE